jgi:serine/threonine-protein kinase
MLSGTRRDLRLATVGLVAALGIFASEPAHAQDASGKAAAESLFESGVQLMKSGRFSEACPKLETSQRIDPGVGTLLYLAECYEKLGRTASAWATFREAESMARASGQTDRASTAQARGQKLEGELSYLTVNVPADARVEGLIVRRGSVNLLPELFGAASPVDPGTIEIEATAPGYQRFTTQVRVTAREKESVTVPKLEVDPNAAAAPPPPAVTGTAVTTSEPTSDAPPKDVPPEPKKNHTLAFVLGGVGIVGIGVGSYFGVRAMQKNKDADEFCDANNVCNDQQGLELTQDAKDAALISNIGFAVGGAALAAGIVLFVVAPGGDESNALRISPRVAKNGGGLSIGGSFR